MNYEEKINEAKRNNIALPKDILEDGIVGIYGFFAVKGKEKYCFYVGKATDMRYRILDSRGYGHIHRYLNDCFNDEKNDLVPRLIRDYLKKYGAVKMEILEQVDYHDEYFSRAAHRLALAEYKWIVEYQNKGQCLDQMPEGIKKDGKEMKFWKKNYCIE